MELQTIRATHRPGIRKNECNRLRRAGQVPAIFYGGGERGVQLALYPKEITKALSTAHGRNAVLRVEVEGEPERLALFGDIQIHPVSRELLHADLKRVSLDKPVHVSVPVETTGKAAGVTAGGELRLVFRRVPVRCLPEQIPAKIVVDVTTLELNAVIPAGKLPVAEGVSVLLPADLTVVAVVTEDKRESAEETAAAATPAAGAAPAAAAAGKGAPAAGGKAAAPAAAAKAPAKDAKKK
ncbi:MAG: 50S ribosomal protein L25 [Deltaproteobacteria bacterium]|nr:50S ribosomal protein L25 [Deltaproteobacteria bacterium]